MTRSIWRKRSRQVIARVVEETGTTDLDLLEKEIRAAYPFGLRKHWPYKVWLSEVKEFMKRLRASEPVDDVDLAGLPLFDREVTDELQHNEVQDRQD